MDRGRGCDYAAPVPEMRDNREKSPDSGKLWTVRRVLQWTQQRFTERGIPSARLDAELLLAHALGRGRVSLYTGLEQPLTPEELTRYRGLIQRRLGGEPVAYLIGRRDFWTLTLTVTPAVLIPRPETETLVEVSLALLPDPPAADDPGPGAAASAEGRAASQEGPAIPGQGELTVHYDPPMEGAADAPTDADQPQAASAAPGPAMEAVSTPAASGPKVADIGTGSGAVALSLKKERPAAQVFAVDCSPEALAVAAGNGASLGLAVTWLQGDLLSPLPPHAPFDLIISNPPYIPSGDIAGLAPEVRSEPHLALDGGADGLRVIRRLVRDALPLLAPGGALAMEVGDGQAGAVAELLRGAGYAAVAIEEDLARTPRVVSARRPA